MILTEWGKENATQVSNLALHFGELSLQSGRTDLQKTALMQDKMGETLQKMKAHPRQTCKIAKSKGCGLAILQKMNFKFFHSLLRQREDSLGQRDFLARERRKICKK